MDRRELMAASALTQSLGPYIVPSELGPKIRHPPKAVNAHHEIQDLLGSVLGPGLGRLESRTSSVPKGPRAILKQTALNQSFVHGVLSNQDVYTLFGSPALSSLIGSQQISGLTGSVSNAPSTSTTTASSVSIASSVGGASASSSLTAIPGTIPTTTPGSITGGPATTSTTFTTIPGTTPGVSSRAVTTDPLVAFSIPDQAVIQSIGSTKTVVLVNATGSSPGFYAEVPTSNLRILDSGPPVTGTVEIPRSAIPPSFPIPNPTFISIGTFSTTYATTAPLLNQILNAGVKRIAPNAPNSVPGLRLAPYLQQNDPFPSNAARKDLLKALRLAVQRNVFALGAGQNDAVSQGISDFANQVQTMSATGQFVPVVPLDPPSLPSKRLSGTLAISVGTVRDLVSVAPGANGLQVPEIGNFLGRLDVGYVVDRAGNYGIMLSVRGALDNANPIPTPVDVAGGDVRVEVSNASSINDLTGRRVLEGVGIGSLVSTDLANSRYENGVSAFSTSAGNGFGLEYGTGVGYSTVIPLGNVYSLIPSAPPG
ncbi:hypothetical protein P12x_003441 [Tundrisphaera lichenicola]|uniref:hypothetical protein n=1 Tax=Tundrisphaera lichenicola TaxID=2029860 RepID=UPI003EBCE3E8